MITEIMGKTMIPMTAVTKELTRIDVSSWNAGVYVIKTNDGYSRKIIVLNQ